LPDLAEGALWGALVGLSLVLGAGVAAAVSLPHRASALLTAFGGGLLLSAVALELVPEADAAAGAGLTALGLVAGTAAYMAADAWLHRDPRMSRMRTAVHAAKAGRMDTGAMAGSGEGDAEHDRQEGNALAAGLVIDGVPESIALGLTIAEGELGLALLAGIVVGNLVEAYGSSQLMIGGGGARAASVRLFAVIGVALAVATALGATVLADASERLVGTAQAVAAGAVLAVISITIVPETFRDITRLVAAAMVAGFVAGYLLGQ
jgi:zinc transporter, ZIP family